MRNFGGPVVRDFTYTFCFFSVLSFSEMDEDGGLGMTTFTLSGTHTRVLLYVCALARVCDFNYIL